MSIRINPEKCVGCARCERVCPGSLLFLVDNKATIPKPEHCWGCTSCVKECQHQAIEFYLGADIGGTGAVAYTERHGAILSWIITKQNGESIQIDIDTRESNRY